LVALALAAASIPRNWFDDDALITFRYAQNLARGRGLVFNPGERVFGFTTPLNALLLAGAARLGLQLELTSRLLAGLGLVILILALRSLSRSVFASPWPGLLTAVLLMTNPIIFFVGLSGMETNLFLGLWTAAFAAHAAGRPGAAVGLASLSLWCRIEGGVVLLVVILGALLFAPEGRKSRLRLLPGLILAGLYPLLAWLYFGRVLPQSVVAKIATPSFGLAGALEMAWLFVKAFLGQGSNWFEVKTPFVVLVPLAGFGALQLPRASRARWAPFFAAPALYGLAYILSSRVYARNFVWYFLPPLPALYLLAAAGILAALGRIQGRWPRLQNYGAVIPIAFSLLWLGACLPSLMKDAEIRSINIFLRERIYATAATWARQALPPGEIMASNEIGGLAYYSDRKVLDLFGLASTKRRDEIEAVRFEQPALLLFRDHFPDQAKIEAALPRAYRWRKWRNLWIGVRQDLRIEVPAPELERIYRELPL
jgi:hypothetical protein